MWPSPDRLPPARRAAGGGLTRRNALGAAVVAGLAVVGRAEAVAHGPQGLVLPRAPAPDLALTDLMGRSVGLTSLLRGKVTGLQLMFAGCSSTCPIQGAVFAAVAQRLKAPDVQLLSLTVDPLGDSPQALRDWLARFGSRHFWTAGAPRVQDVAALAQFLRGVPRDPRSHSSQAFLFDRQARLAFRTVDLPSAEHVASLLEQLAAA